MEQFVVGENNKISYSSFGSVYIIDYFCIIISTIKELTSLLFGDRIGCTQISLIKRSGAYVPAPDLFFIIFYR